MTMLPAARVGDAIEHSPELLGFAVGAIVGVAAVAITAALTAATGGLALVALAAAGAVGGGIIGEVASHCFSGIETGVLTEGSPNIFINGKAAIGSLHTAEPCWIPLIYPHGKQCLVEGSGSVLFNCRPASRVGDALLCDATVAVGSPNVLIGGPKTRVNGTEKGFLSFLLSRLGFVISAVSMALFPASVVGSLSGVGLFQASYDVHKRTTETVGGWLGIDPALAAFGIETAIGIGSGTLASKIPVVGSWSTLNHVARAQAWQRYGGNWDWSRWSNNWAHLNRVRPFSTRIQDLERTLSSLVGVGGVEIGALDFIDLLNGMTQTVLGMSEVPEGQEGQSCSCDSSWYSSAEP